MEDDTELLERWRGGDAAAGATLVRRHTAGLLRMFHGRVAAPVDAVQEVLLGCVRSRDRVPDGLPFRVYLFGVARRVLLHELRRAARHRAPDELDEQALVGEAARPSEVIAGAQERRRLARALHELPHELQMAVMLHYWEGFRMHEVAAACEIPEGTVKSRLSRARALLREALAHEVSDPAELQATLAGLETWARAQRDNDG